MILYTFGFYAVTIGFLYHFQKRIIFQPDLLEADYSFQFDTPFEELFLETPDGAAINALYFKTARKSKGVALYFHGNSGNLQRWGEFHRDFNSRGYDFFAIDYRGFGKSGGEIREDLLYQDARLAYEWLLKQYSPKQIVICGRSLGAAIASQLATKVPAKMLLLETPFHSIKDMSKIRFPYLWFPFPTAFRFPNDENIQKVSYPVFIVQGTKDLVVPFRSAIKLKPLLKPGDEFFILQGAGHKDFTGFPEYQKFLDELFL